VRCDSFAAHCLIFVHFAPNISQLFPGTAAPLASPGGKLSAIGASSRLLTDEECGCKFTDLHNQPDLLRTFCALSFCEEPLRIQEKVEAHRLSTRIFASQLKSEANLFLCDVYKGKTGHLSVSGLPF
jgi:hypothetical protein